jgi:membrane dipeptidase
MLAPFTLGDEPWLTDPDTFTPELVHKFRSSGINIFHIAEGIGGPSDAVAAVSRFVGLWNGFIATHSDHFMRIDSAADLASVVGSGKIGVLVGVQNSEHFETLEDVGNFYSLGQRVSLLTYNSRNRIGDGCTERVDAGITDYGLAVVRRMNEVGMAVDVSHCGDRTTLDSIEVSRKPVLISHSNARELVPGHPRCKTDAAIMAMAAKGGVMGISSVRMFVRDREPTTIEHLLDHFDYVVQLVGVEHVGLGSDMDLEGYDDLPEHELANLRSAYADSYRFRDRIDIEGLDHPKRVFDLTEGLIRRGYSDADILLMLGGNFQRVLSEIWSPYVGATGAARS